MEYSSKSQGCIQPPCITYLYFSYDEMLCAASSNAINNFEDMNGIERGSRASVLSAMAFGEYFPNPGITQQPFLTDEENASLPLTNGVVNSWQCMLTEAWGTFMLSAVIFAVTEKKNDKVGSGHLLAPMLIGGLIAINLSVYAPLTQVRITSFSLDPDLRHLLRQ